MFLIFITITHQSGYECPRKLIKTDEIVDEENIQKHIKYCICDGEQQLLTR